jgi:HSP20 family protein
MKGTEMNNTQVEKNDTENEEQAPRERKSWWEPVLSPRTDIVEAGDHFLLEVELPGVPADAVILEVEDDELRISGERSEKEIGKPDYLMRERRPGSYSRAFRLGSQIDREGIEGKMTDGVLKVRIPKHKSALPRRISIRP